MNPPAPIDPASPAGEPDPASSKPSTAPVETPAQKGERPPVKPDDASDNAQGNEIRDEDLELSDDSAAGRAPGGATRNS